MKNYTMTFGSGDPRTFTGLAPTFLIFVREDTGATITSPAITEALTGSGIYTFQWGATTPIGFLADAATTSPGAQGRYVVGQIDPADRSDEYGNTLTAIGTTLTSIGYSGLVYGISLAALGSSLAASSVTLTSIGYSGLVYGSSLAALGASNIALGTSAVALGATNIAIGTSLTATGISLSAISVTILANTGSSSGVDALIGTVGSTFGGQNTDPIDLFGYAKRILENLEGDQTYIKSTGILSINSRSTSSDVLLRNKTVANSSSAVIKSGL